MNYDDREGMPMDCPLCDSPVVYNDTGINCSNPECPNGTN